MSIRHSRTSAGASTQSDPMRDFFMSLYTPDSISARASPAPSSSLTLVEDNLFAPDREAYDFENLSPMFLSQLQDMLDNDDYYTKKFALETDSNGGLDPYAQAFVPKNQKASLGPSPGPGVPRDRFPWLKPLPLRVEELLAIAAREAPSHHDAIKEHARTLVHSRIWEFKELAELARHFIWKACDPKSDAHPHTLGLFALDIARRFLREEQVANASYFAAYLKDNVTGLFEKCWDTSNGSAIRFDPTRQYDRAYVYCAFRLLGFIGTLYCFGFLDATYVSNCLQVLVYQMSSVEHLEAIRIILETSAVYRKPNKNTALMYRFVKAFSGHTRKLRPESSALWAPGNPAQLEHMIHAVWETVMAQSGVDKKHILAAATGPPGL